MRLRSRRNNASNVSEIAVNIFQRQLTHRGRGIAGLVTPIGVTGLTLAAMEKAAKDHKYILKLHGSSKSLPKRPSVRRLVASSK